MTVSDQNFSHQGQPAIMAYYPVHQTAMPGDGRVALRDAGMLSVHRPSTRAATKVRARTKPDAIHGYGPRRRANLSQRLTIPYGPLHSGKVSM